MRLSSCGMWMLHEQCEATHGFCRRPRLWELWRRWRGLNRWTGGIRRRRPVDRDDTGCRAQRSPSHACTSEAKGHRPPAPATSPLLPRPQELCPDVNWTAPSAVYLQRRTASLARRSCNHTILRRRLQQVSLLASLNPKPCCDEATPHTGSWDHILPLVLKHICADIVKPRFVAQHPRNFNLLVEAYWLAFVKGREMVSSVTAPATPHRPTITGFTTPSKAQAHPRLCQRAAACCSYSCEHFLTPILSAWSSVTWAACHSSSHAVLSNCLRGFRCLLPQCQWCTPPA